MVSNFHRIPVHFYLYHHLTALCFNPIVYDMGDWWSHTVQVSKYDGDLEDETSVSVAHLVSGTGQCPIEDIHGVDNYCMKMMKLSGVVEPKPYVKLTPSSEAWWNFFNDEIRVKPNVSSFSPLLEFDLDDARKRLSIALHDRIEDAGNEFSRLTETDFRTGVISSKQGIDDSTEVKELRPTERCAVCGVTVALKLCSGCRSVAFCCREHQVQHWPSHKAICRQVQKRNQSKA